VAAEVVSALEPHHGRHHHEQLRKVFAESSAEKAAHGDSGERDVYFSVGFVAKSNGNTLKADEVCKGADHCCTKFKALPAAQLKVLQRKLAKLNSRIDEKDLDRCAWDYEMPGCLSPREKDKKWFAHARTREHPGKGALICQNDGGWVKVVLNQEKEKANCVTLHLAKDESPHARLIEEAPKDLADNKFSGGFYRNWGTEEENKNRHKYKFYSTQTLADRLGNFAVAGADGQISYKKFYAKTSGAGAFGNAALSAGKGAAMDALKSAAGGGSLQGAAMGALSAYAKGPAGQAALASAKRAAMSAASNYLKKKR